MMTYSRVAISLNVLIGVLLFFGGYYGGEGQKFDWVFMSSFLIACVIVYLVNVFLFGFGNETPSLRLMPLSRRSAGQFGFIAGINLMCIAFGAIVADWIFLNDVLWILMGLTVVLANLQMARFHRGGK